LEPTKPAHIPAIQVLPDAVIDQIAAGEVVERPASVVKELVENALDAGAQRIHVEVREGGKQLIRVVDDGRGMTPDELRLAIQRHATSKLRAVDDLSSLATMGFRGEALPTIASVSRFSITSRAGSAGQAAALRVEGGKVGEVEPAGAAPGTTVEAADLFFNTPARLKFLKSTATEAAHITDMVNRAALCAPRVHFSLVTGGRKPVDLPPCQDRLERCRAVLARWADSLVAGERQVGPLRAEAILAPPSESLRTSRQLVLAVNGRHVRDRALLQAVLAGFGPMMDRGRFPVAVVYLDLPPDCLDVNVHPQKTEVRFAEPRRIFSLVKGCVEELLASSRWLEQGAGRAAGQGRSHAPARRYSLNRSSDAGYDEHKQRLMEATRRFWSRRPSERGGAAREQSEAPYPADGEAARGYAASVGAEPGGYFSSLTVVGQAMGLFVVCEGQDEVVLIDQHAAHERVTFERLRAAADAGSVPTQRLLVPEPVELDPRLAATAEAHAGALEELGLEAEHFGGEAWAVRAVPAALAGANPVELLRDLLESLTGESEGSDVVQESGDATLARMACHGSVRQGRSLSEQEMSALLRALDRVDFATACPHGRPVMVRLSRQELERRLKR